MSNNMDDFNEFEEETKLELIKLHDAADNSKAKNIIDSISAELEKWFSEVKKFITEHKDSEKVQDTIDNVKVETAKVMSKVKEKVNDVKDDDKVKDFIDATSETLQSLQAALNDNETYSKVKDSIVTTFDNIKNDENIIQGVKKVKKSTLSLAKKALNKIEKALDDEDEIVVHTIKKENEDA